MRSNFEVEGNGLNPDLHPLLYRIYLGREIVNFEEIELGLENLLSPTDLLGLNKASDLLCSALEKQSRILIVADFDADGATSCVLAIQALRSFGFNWVDYIVPNRFEFGYGLTPEIVEMAKSRHPDLIITVDNGISSVDGVDVARASGIQTLVTDHHLAGQVLPKADVIVNPNQPGCRFKSKALAGVGVIFYLMLGVRRALRERDYFKKKGVSEPRLSELLDLVALGTVADVVPLDRNNRILVDEGIKRIRAGRSRPGIYSLLKLAAKDPANIVASDLGFYVGPRLNAAGRLDDMTTGIECLLAGDESSSYSFACQLDAMNTERKTIEAKMKEEAFSVVETLTLDGESLPAGICLFDPNWHQGVVGLVASRVKDKWHRPTIAFAFADASRGDKELKGSARSIGGIHIRDVLETIDNRHPDLIEKFGGHAMAAGLSLKANQLSNFKTAFNLRVEEVITEEQLYAQLVTDGELEETWFKLEVAEMLAAAGPWGQGFPEPTFHGDFSVVQHRRVGANHLKLVLRSSSNSPELLDAIAFNIDEEDWPKDNIESMRIVFRLDINEYRGVRRLQLLIQYIIEMN